MTRVGALVAVLLYLSAYFSLGFWHTSHVESFLLPFVLLGYQLYIRSCRLEPARKKVLLFLSGVFLGLTP